MIPQRFPINLDPQSINHRLHLDNRLHLDVPRHSGDDRDAPVQRLADLGPTMVDVGQNAPWTVLANPEGNQFCVLSARDR